MNSVWHPRFLFASALVLGLSGCGEDSRNGVAPDLAVDEGDRIQAIVYRPAPAREISGGVYLRRSTLEPMLVTCTREELEAGHRPGQESSEAAVTPAATSATASATVSAAVEAVPPVLPGAALAEVARLPVPCALGAAAVAPAAQSATTAAVGGEAPGFVAPVAPSGAAAPGELVTPTGGSTLFGQAAPAPVADPAPAPDTAEPPGSIRPAARSASAAEVSVPAFNAGQRSWIRSNFDRMLTSKTWLASRSDQRPVAIRIGKPDGQWLPADDPLVSELSAAIAARSDLTLGGRAAEDPWDVVMVSSALMRQGQIVLTWQVYDREKQRLTTQTAISAREIAP